MKSLRELFAKASIPADARHKLRQFNLAPLVDGKARSVKELAQSLGFSVFATNLEPGVSGLLTRDEFSDNGWVIEVNASERVESRRFAVLHEMGHFFLHRRSRDEISDSAFLDRSSDMFYVDDREEKQANDFADVLLFGDGALEAAFSLYGGCEKRLARHFGVTEAMISVAVKKFGLKRR